MLAWVDSVDPGMRRFGFNPFGRDVADEIHADLLRLAAAGKIRPVDRPAGRHGGGRPGARRARGPPIARPHRGRDRARLSDGGGRCVTSASSTPGATPSCAAGRCAPSTGSGERLQHASDVERPRARPGVGRQGRGQARPGPTTSAATRFREPLEVFLRSCEDEAELTTFGRFLVSQDAGRRALANRIAAAALVGRAPRGA